MKTKPILTGLTIAFVISGEVVPHKEHTLVAHHREFEQPHYDREMQVDPVVISVAVASASGRQTRFDNEEWSPRMPWAHWWPADQGHMAAAERMLRLGE